MNELAVVNSSDVFFDIDKMQSLFKSCSAIAKVPFLKPDLRGKPEAILAIVLMAKELNIPPMTALSSMHFIKGVPTLPASTMLALARTRVPGIFIKVDADLKTMTATVSGSRTKDDGQLYTSVWDMDRAKQMGLVGRDQYIKQPLTMLKWRGVCDVIRVVAPEAIQGIYGWEEFKKLDGSDIEETLEQKLAQDIKDSIEDQIPEEERKLGNEYRIVNGKYSGTQFKDMDKPEFEEFIAYLEKQMKSKAAKPWQDELHALASQYLMEWDHYHILLEEAWED